MKGLGRGFGEKRSYQGVFASGNRGGEYSHATEKLLTGSMTFVRLCGGEAGSEGGLRSTAGVCTGSAILFNGLSGAGVDAFHLR